MHNRLYQAITRCSRLISIFFFIFFLTATQVLAEMDSKDFIQDFFDAQKSGNTEKVMKNIRENPNTTQAAITSLETLAKKATADKAKSYNTLAEKLRQLVDAVKIPSGSVVSQPEFKRMYAPHNKLKVPDDKTVNTFKDMDMRALPVALDMLIENINLGQEVKNILVNLLTSLPREKIGDALGKMSEPNQILCINMLSDEYALDLIYYIPEAAYNRIADKLNALKVDKYSKKGATSSSVSPDQSPQHADQYWNQAEAAKKNGRYLEAAQLYEKSAEAEKKTTIRGLQIYL